MSQLDQASSLASSLLGSFQQNNQANQTNQLAAGLLSAFGLSPPVHSFPPFQQYNQTNQLAATLPSANQLAAALSSAFGSSTPVQGVSLHVNQASPSVSAGLPFAFGPYDPCVSRVQKELADQASPSVSHVREDQPVIAHEGQLVKLHDPSVSRVDLHYYHDHAADPIIEPWVDNLVKDARKTWPIQLHDMLSSVEADGFAHVISWQPHGRCFIVHKPEEFVNDVMPIYFKLCLSFNCFRRELHVYGFKMLTVGPDMGGYYHERFLRGKVSLAYGIYRMNLKGTAPQSVDPSNRPRFFYALPPVTPDDDDAVEIGDENENTKPSKQEEKSEEDDVVEIGDDGVIDLCGKGSWKLLNEGGTKPRAPAVKWSPKEDAALRLAVNANSDKNWKKIASHLPGRSGGRCRERWYNHLSPDIRKGGWTDEEDTLIIDSHARLGNKWAEISKLLVGRPDNEVKKRWNNTLKKRVCGGNAEAQIQNYRQNIQSTPDDDDAVEIGDDGVIDLCGKGGEVENIQSPGFVSNLHM